MDFLYLHLHDSHYKTMFNTSSYSFLPQQQHARILVHGVQSIGELLDSTRVAFGVFHLLAISVLGLLASFLGFVHLARQQR